MTCNTRPVWGSAQQMVMSQDPTDPCKTKIEFDNHVAPDDCPVLGYQVQCMTNKCQDWKTMELNATELGMSSMTKTSELAEYLNLNNGDSLVCISLARNKFGWGSWAG